MWCVVYLGLPGFFFPCLPSTEISEIWIWPVQTSSDRHITHVRAIVNLAGIISWHQSVCALGTYDKKAINQECENENRINTSLLIRYTFYVYCDMRLCGFILYIYHISDIVGLIHLLLGKIAREFRIKIGRTRRNALIDLIYWLFIEYFHAGQIIGKEYTDKDVVQSNLSKLNA